MICAIWRRAWSHCRLRLFSMFSSTSVLLPFCCWRRQDLFVSCFSSRMFRHIVRACVCVCARARNGCIENTRCESDDCLKKKKCCYNMIPDRSWNVSRLIHTARNVRWFVAQSFRPRHTHTHTHTHTCKHIRRFSMQCRPFNSMANGVLRGTSLWVQPPIASSFFSEWYSIPHSSNSWRSHWIKCFFTGGR